MNESRDTGHLLTEKINPRTTRLDECATEEIIELIMNEDRYILDAVSRELNNISAAVDLISERLERGGRLIFAGAGTSGRLGVMEAAECPPTFGTDPSQVQALMAGGERAVIQSIEGAEDSVTESVDRLRELDTGGNDVVVGIAASSTTPYVESALEYARDSGSATVFVTCNPVEQKLADVTITLTVGPEVLVGSTRMKAGTATKMVLNMLTTASMVKLGKTFGNLMVDVQPRSAKLRDRAKRIVMQISGVSGEYAEKLLLETEWNVKEAVLMGAKNIDREKARSLLKSNRGRLREALK